MRATLGKEERLYLRKRIDFLFASGQAHVSYPVRCVICLSNPADTGPQEAPLQVLFAASKKKFPRAVDRNRKKRLLREAYRLEKSHLYSLAEKKCFVALQYIGTSDESLENLRKAVRLAVEKGLALAYAVS